MREIIRYRGETFSKFYARVRDQKMGETVQEYRKRRGYAIKKEKEMTPEVFSTAIKCTCGCGLRIKNIGRTINRTMGLISVAPCEDCCTKTPEPTIQDAINILERVKRS